MDKNVESVKSLYHDLIRAWNQRSASGMASLFANEGNVVGFDGSQLDTRAEILASMTDIFSKHPTAPFVTIIREIRPLSADSMLLRAVVGMTPEGQTEINPALNAIQTLVAQKKNERWMISLFQNTPAAFHGRPDLVEKLTEELKLTSKNQKPN